MTPADLVLRASIAAALKGITPTMPIALEDTLALFELLHPLVAKPYLLDVYFTTRIVRVTIKRANEIVMHVELTAIDV